MEREIFKNYRGCIDIKEYDRQACIDRKEDLIVEHRGGFMTLTWRMLKNKVRFKSDEKFTCKDQPAEHPGPYYLYSYTWNPDSAEEENNVKTK